MVNQVKVEGRLVSDAVTKDLGNSKILSFSIAVNEKFTAKNGEQKEIVSFFDIEAIGQAASATLKKGDLVTIEGSLRQDRWESPSGERKSKVKIVAFKISPQKSPGKKSPETVETVEI